MAGRLRFKIDRPTALPVSIRVRHVFPFKKAAIFQAACVLFLVVKFDFFRFNDQI